MELIGLGKFIRSIINTAKKIRDINIASFINNLLIELRFPILVFF